MKRFKITRRPVQDERRGAVLLIAMGILALLAIFAVAFTNIVSLEKKASKNYVDAIRARMIARAGLERAIAELRKIAEKKPYDDIRATTVGGDAWVYQQRYQSGTANLAQTRFISFPTQADQVDFIDLDNPAGAAQPYYYSGKLGASYTNGMDAYRLKVLDCASMLHVNTNDSAALERMLKNLLRAHGVSSANATTIAQRVRQRRPGGGYRTKPEVGMIMRNGSPAITEAQWNKIRDDITCFAWKDNKVILPPRTSTTTGGTTTTSSGSNSDVFLTERAPVNINTASKEVLTAVFAEIAGNTVEIVRTFNGSTSTKTEQTTNSTTISYNEAEDLAQRVVVRRASTTVSGEGGGGPFRSWFEFEVWLDSLSWGSNNKRDLVKAMVNPNTDISLRKWGLEGNHIFRWDFDSSGGTYLPTDPRIFDKTDLTAITTELCFSSMGFFEITSLGQVWGPGRQQGTKVVLAELRAAQTVQSVVQVFNVLRLTTQRDFEVDREYLDPKLFLEYTKGSTGSVEGFTDLANEEGAWPATVTQPEYSNKHNPPDLSSGTSAGSGAGTGADFFTLHTDFNPSNIDGQIILNGLARIQATDPDFMVGFARGSLKPLKVRFYENDVALWGSPNLGNSRRTSQAQLDQDIENGRIKESDAVRNPSTAVSLTNSEATPRRSLLNPGGSFGELFSGAGLTNLGVLITDDREKYLVYNGNNLDLRQGTVHFWVKPVRDPASSGKEVYFNWFGGITRDGAREAGFEIYKTRVGNDIKIIARFFGLNGNRRGDAFNPLEFNVGRVSGSTLTKDSLWKAGQWNHIQLAFGVDTTTEEPQYTANLIVNSQEIPGGTKPISQYQFNGQGVRHAYVNGSPVQPATTTALAGTGRRGFQWFWPYLFYDYYYCDGGGASETTVTYEEDKGLIRVNPQGQYVRKTLPKIDFPEGAEDEEVIIQFEPSNWTPEGATPPPPASAVPPLGEDYDASAYPNNSEDPPTADEWYYGPTQDVRDNRWHLRIIMRWTQKAVRKGICPDCRNCQDCSKALGKDPTAFQGSVTQHCYNRFPVSSGVNTLGECDDCEGCEACDVDGPAFIGCELYFQGNPDFVSPVQGKVGSAFVDNSDVDTDAVFNFANAVIDNIYFLGYRVDEEENAVDEVPSDRFFDQDVARVNENKANARGHKPGFKKLLSSLYGQRFRIGTVSWTGYPAFTRKEAGLGGELDPDSLLPVTITLLKWDFSKANSQTIDYVDGNSIQPGFLEGICSSNPTSAVNTKPGYNPLNAANINDPDRGGEGLFPTDDRRSVSGSEILILSVDFAPNLLNRGSVSQTPVLNDVTITYFTTPKIIYTEEGVDE